MARQCGEILARIHSLAPGAHGTLPVLSAPTQIENYRAALDDMGEAHPGFELGLRWLERNPPPKPAAESSENRLVHGDFRNGNLIVDGSGPSR